MSDFLFLLWGWLLAFAALLFLIALLYCLEQIIRLLFPRKPKQEMLSKMAYEFVEEADRYVRGLPVHDE